MAKTDEQKAEHCLKTLDFLKETRQPFEDMVDKVTTYVNHSRRKINSSSKGGQTGVEVFDGSAIRAKNLLVDGMVGYMCARTLRWFSCHLPGVFNFPKASRNLRQWNGKPLSDMNEVRKWLEEYTECGYQALNYSNFYDVIPEFISDGAVPGTAHMIVEEDVGNGQQIFTVPHFRECYIANDRFGRVNTLYRVYNLTLLQLIDMFGIDKMKEVYYDFADRAERNPYDEMEILHAVFPRESLEPNRYDARNKKVASYYVLTAKKHLLGESGFDSMPSVSWRWRRNSDEVYGRSPSWDAYVDVMVAQQQGRSNLIAGQKMAEPPMVGNEDTRGSVHDGPQGWTWVSTMEEAPRPLSTGINVPYSVELQDRTVKAIREHFHVDFFLMLLQATMNKVELTATQVVGMQGEQAAVLGTRIGNLQSEAFDPILDRMFEIEERAGRLPKPPDVVMEVAAGKRIDIRYLGPLSEAQKRLSKTRSLEAGIQYAGIVSQIFPEAIDKVNGDEVMSEGLESYGFPVSCMNDDETVKKIREMKAKQVQEAQAIEAMPKIARAMQSAGKGMDANSPMSGLAQKFAEEGAGEEMEAEE